MLHGQMYFDRPINIRLDRIADKKQKASNSSSDSKLPPGLKGLGMGLGINGVAITDVASKLFFYLSPFAFLEFLWCNVY